jgi:hypothetical protein
MHRLLLLLPLLLAAEPTSAPSPWTALAPGLDLGVFEAGRSTIAGDGRVRVLRVDPARWQPVLLNASADPELGARTAKDWVQTEGLVAAINASMFLPDHRMSTALMRRPGHVNNPRRSRDNAVLVVDEGRATLLDASCDDLDAELPTWGTAIQSIRMLRCDGRNVWSQQDKRWSHAVIGLDGAGRLLLVHARSPWTTHDFVDLLVALPLDLKRLQCAEGGPEAQLYVAHGDTVLDAFGSYETGFFESDANDRAWPVPNVLGIRAAPPARSPRDR